MKKVFTIERVKFYGWTSAAFLLLYALAESFAYPETIAPRVINTFILMLYLTPLHLFFFEYALPQLSIKSGKLLKSLLFIFVFILLYSVGLYYWREGWIQLSVYQSFHSSSSTIKAIIAHSQFSIATVLFVGTIRHFYHYSQLKKDKRQLLIEKQQAELSFLKSQTNPHFLFNTLNNIYSLAQEKSDLAPEAILRLSRILRFTLYESSGKYISIDQELMVLNNYISLEKLRHDDSLRINFVHHVDNLQQQLPPLLLMPLVENAFKHGIAETSNDGFLDIWLEIEKGHLRFTVKNSMGEEENIRESIGLSNLRRQLELLYKDHNLHLHRQNGVFTAILNINLSSHV